MGVPNCRRPSKVFFCSYAIGLGTTRGTAVTFSRAPGFSAIARRDLPHRIHFTVGTDCWLGRQQRYFAGQPHHAIPPPASRRAESRLEPLSPAADAVLAQQQRPLPEGSVRRRRRLGGCADDRHRARAMFAAAVADLSLTYDRLPGIPGISMGQLAAGNGLAGGLLRSIDPGAQRSADHGPFAGRAVAAALALIPTDVSIRVCQTAQR